MLFRGESFLTYYKSGERTKKGCSGAAMGRKTRDRGREAATYVFKLFLIAHTAAISRKAAAYGTRKIWRLAPTSVHDGQRRWSRRDFVELATANGALLIVPTPAGAMSTDPQSGVALPDVGEIESFIPTDWSDVENPFLNADAKTIFGRLDASPDSIFYTDPRFVEHVDESAVELMTKYVSMEATSKGDSVLDLCSSWTSHIEPSKANELKRVEGLGMNSKELQENDALTEWTVQDLNSKPQLPYKDNVFDVVLCQLSIDYLTRPLEVLAEVCRVLKPGGKVHILFSNRLFLSKAVGLWTGADDLDHVYYVACYLHFCGGAFVNICAKDLSNRRGRDKRIIGDPMYVVVAQKQ